MPRIRASAAAAAAALTTALLVTGGALPGSHGTSRQPAEAGPTPVPRARAAGTPYDFADVPVPAVAPDGRAHAFTVSYRNPAAAARAVAFQVLVESPVQGPFLQPRDVRLERYDPAGRRWLPVTLASQTGTLYTPIPPAGRPLPGGARTSARYRLAFTRPGAVGAPATVLPRVVLYRGTTGA